MTLQATDKVQEVCSFEWRKLDDTQEQTALEVAHLEETKQSHKNLLPPMPQTSLQIEADKKDHPRVKRPESYIPKETKQKLCTLLKEKYNSIVSKISNRNWMNKPN